MCRASDADYHKSFVIRNGDSRLGTGTIAGGVFLSDGKVGKPVAIDSNSCKHGPGFGWVPLCLSRAEEPSRCLDDP